MIEPFGIYISFGSVNCSVRYGVKESDITKITPTIAVDIFKILFSTLYLLIDILILSLFGVGYLLYVGIDISSILKKYHIENNRCFIQLKDSIYLDIDTISIPVETNSSEETKIPSPYQILEYIDIFKLLFGEITIHNLKIGDIALNLHYSKDRLIAENRDYYLDTTILNSDRTLLVRIDRAETKKFHLSTNGSILFRADTNSTIFALNPSIYPNSYKEISGKLVGEIANFQNVDIFFKSQKIRTLSGLFEILQLGQGAWTWGVDRAKYDHIQLSAITHFPISQPHRALENLEAIGHISNISYIFQPKLFPVKSDRIDFHLKNSNLYLYSQLLRYGNSKVIPEVEITDIFSKLHLYLHAKGDLQPDEVLQKTILYYSGLKKIPLQLPDHIPTDYYYDMKLYDDFRIRFFADVHLPKEPTKLRKDIQIWNGEITYLFPQNYLTTNRTKFQYRNITTGDITGWVDLPNKKIDIGLNISKLEKQDMNISMKSPRLLTRVAGEFNRSINIQLSPLNIQYQNIDINLSDTNISYQIPRSKIAIDLGIDKFQFSEINISNERVPIYIQLGEEKNISIPKLATYIDIGKKVYITLKDLALFLKYLPISKKYPISQTFGGDIRVEIEDNNISYSGSINIAQKILKLSDKAISSFHINGSVVDGNIESEVNNHIFFSKDGKIEIYIDEVDFNLSGIDDFVVEENKTEEEKNGSINIDPEIDVYIKDGTIYLDDNHSFPFEYIFVNGRGKDIYINITPHRGEIVAKVTGKKYIAKATNISGSLIQKISNFYGISGGDFNLYIKGEGENLEGLLQLRRLKIKNIGLVNNILAFINTIPALMTFSRPGFNHNGLRIMAGYVDFAKVGDIVKIEKFDIRGENINLFGDGVVDLGKMKLDINLNISAMKYYDRVIANIPIANYLILGDDGSISTMLKIEGNISNPNISTNIPNELISAPSEFGRRIYNLPNRLLQFFKSLNIIDEEDRESVREFF
ncbi:MAG TPA: hypothetical protein EYO61_06485, partial [Campylobacterales bacterium]|nr:hypothetical protein [Campylobacterales bacterium]